MKSIKFYPALTLLALVSSLFLNAQVQQELPAGATPDWFASVKTSIQQMEYKFFPGTTVNQFRAANSGNHLGFQIQAGGYTVQNMKRGSGDKTWDVRFTINGIGRNSVKPFDKNATVILTNGSLTYQTKMADVQYINDEKGLRQNFIVKERPAGNGKLSASLQVQTSLTGEDLGDNKLVFHAAGNNKDVKLIYDELKVWDADNKALDASMSFDKKTDRIIITVNDENATYPVTIDPLNRTPEWEGSAAAVLPALTTALQVHSLYGITVAGLGDVNGDGFDDVAVSAPSLADVFTGSGSLTGVGAVFVYFGSPTGLPNAPSKSLQPSTPITGALFGYSVAGGDVTGDGINDIIVGAPLDRADIDLGGASGVVQATVGKVYIYQGGLLTGTTPTPLLSVSLNAPLLSPTTVTLNALFGFSLDVTADLNNDGKGEIIVGAPTYARLSGINAVKTGGAFIFMSNASNTFSTVKSLAPPTGALLGLLDEVESIVKPIIGPILWAILETVLNPLLNGQIEGLLFGYSVDGLGDYNTDGFKDVVVGAPAGVNLGGLNAILSGQILGGSAYVFGGTGTPAVPIANSITTDISTTPMARLQASPTGLLSNAANLFGYEVRGVTGVNGIRNGNVLVGAPTGSVIPNTLPTLQIKTGQVLVFKKKATGFVFSAPVGSDQSLSSPRSSSILSILLGQTINVSLLYGSSIDNMLDVNCDGFGDIIVGEPTSTNVPLIGANVVGGSAYIYLGQPNGLYVVAPFWDLTTVVSPLLGVNTTSLIGYSVAGARYVKGRAQGARALVGGPSNSLDFGIGLLNLGNTLGTTLDFAFDNNGLGKAYVFPFSSCNITLPASLIEFKGKAIDKTVGLNWTSVTEVNLNLYELQRSIDGQHYETIVLAFAKGSQRNDYAYIDKHPYMGMNYYRLKMVDKDGQFTYSNIVAVPFNEKIPGDIVVAPNPVQDDIHIKMDGMEKGVYRLELLNTAGQVMSTRSITISQFTQTETIERNGSMASGIYWLNVYNSTNQKVKSLRVLLTSL